MADRLIRLFTGVMKNEEYERAYYDARQILHNRGKKVGSPSFGSDLIRVCAVNGFLLKDEEVLREAWGEGLTHEILAELSESDPLPNCCPEGNRLWQNYCDSTRLNLEILKQESPASEIDSATVSNHSAALRDAARARLHNRRSLLEHAAAHSPIVH
jgi:hypothetical protein